MRKVAESLVFVSDDTVFRVTKQAMEHLQLTRGLSLETIIHWTDGCFNQYKSEGPFSDIFCALGDFNHGDFKFKFKILYCPFQS